ncbi:MAG: type III secretion T3S chaperone [Chlamydiae bacterium]|nr:type III secretion T3S chaperone [Chlamydiota bacterium]
MEKYPLEQLITIKEKKLEEAEKVLRQKKEILQREREVLVSLEEERDKVKEHKDLKLAQLREMLDTGARTDKIRQMKDYLSVVQEELKKKEIKVKNQLAKVEIAEREVEEARKMLVKKQKEMEKLVQHRKEWTKEMAYEIERKEELVSDEIGTVRHVLKKHHAKSHKRSNRGKK